MKDLAKIEEVAWRVGSQLSELAKGLFDQAVVTEIKKDRTVVSRADREIENLAIALLAKETPDFGFVGEEFGKHPKLKFATVGSDRNLKAEESLSFVPQSLLDIDLDSYWLLDPIDGTINFLSKVPTWSVLLTFVQNGVPVFGSVWLPALNEVFLGSKGRGARFGTISAGLGALTPTFVRAAVNLKEAHVSCSSPRTFQHRGADGYFSHLLSDCAELRTHSDAFGHTRVLKGGIDAMIDPIVAPYDVAGLQVLFDETQGAYCGTLHNHEGDLRFRQGSFVTGSSLLLVKNIQQHYQSWCANLAHKNNGDRTLDVPFHLAFEMASARDPSDFSHKAKGHKTALIAKCIETATALFLQEHPHSFIEDLCILNEESESISVSLHQGNLVKPHSLEADAVLQIRATVDGGFSNSSVQSGGEKLVECILQVLKSAHRQGHPGTRILSSRDQVMGILGNVPFDISLSAENFSAHLASLEENCRSKIEILQAQNISASISCGLSHEVKKRSQIFLDGSQHAYAVYTLMVSGSVTIERGKEKRSCHFRIHENSQLEAVDFAPKVLAELEHALQMAQALHSAPPLPMDSEYSHLAIDADLLGLILHEALGHGAEGDLISLGSSGFGSADFLASDRKVAAHDLSVCIDGTLQNCGYLPIDSEGVLPTRKTIVRNGVLIDAIHTRQTARELQGVPDGCARQESLHVPALNRMTSIWLICENTQKMPLSNQESWHRLDPSIVSRTLEESGDLWSGQGGKPANEILFLSGWKGGTASCSNLEFRADVAHIYSLKSGRAPQLLREANFTGIATACFQNVVKSFGPHLCRTIGTCGKDSQGVQTSDGGPALVLMKRNEDVHLIGVGDSDES